VVWSLLLVARGEHAALGVTAIGVLAIVTGVLNWTAGHGPLLVHVDLAAVAQELTTKSDRRACPCDVAAREPVRLRLGFLARATGISYLSGVRPCLLVGPCMIAERREHGGLVFRRIRARCRTRRDAFAPRSTPRSL
jgi:hypothetical protein